jgi:hypothetical protein
MIKPPSLQSSYTYVWSRDPALQLPEDPAEAERVLALARQTGNWAPIVAEGQSPTMFQLRPLERTDISWINGEAQLSSEHKRPLGSLEVDDLTVRLALKSIDNFGANKVTFARVGSMAYVAKPDIINAIHAACGEAGPELFRELAQHIVQRAMGVLPPL